MYVRDTQIRHLKQKEFFDANMHLKEPDENDTQPQLFVNEVLKMYAKGDLKEDALDEQVMTMIIGVSANQHKCVANYLQ